MEHKKPLVVFVIVCWNNIDLLEECFASIQNQTYIRHRTIVVDNASTDDSVAYIRKHQPDATLLLSETNNGFAIGNNQGIAKALEDQDSTYIVLLNTDARLDPDWLAEMVAFASNKPRGAAFQSLTVDYYDHTVTDSRGIGMDHQGRAIQYGYREPVKTYPATQVYGVNAAAALFSTAFLRKQPFGSDVFDSDMWMYLEDVDLATRSVLLGWENWYVDRSRAYHMGSASSGKNPGWSIFMSYRNNAYLMAKNFPITIIIRLLPGLIATELQSIYRHIRGRNRIAIKAMVRARAYSLTHLGVYIRKRKILRQATTIKSNELWSMMQDPFQNKKS